MWIVTDGAAGNEKQCLALAHAMGVAPEQLRLSLRKPWEWLAPHFRNGGRRAIVGPLRDRLNGELPDILLTCGRRATLASTTIKRISAGRTFTVHLLDPRIDPALFDVVVCPAHDQLSGDRVISMLGAPNAITTKVMADARQRWAPQLATQETPRVAVLIGASNSAYQVDADSINRIADVVDGWLGRHQGSTLVTTSRRTPADLKALVWQRFASSGRVWTGSDEQTNPYLGFLAYADAFVVTPDSVNMCSEAASTGRPLYIELPAKDPSKFAQFHQALRDGGFSRSLDDAFDTEPVQALSETTPAASEIMRRYAVHTAGR